MAAAGDSLVTAANSRKAFWLLLAVYAACLLALLSRLSLWLDEIVDLKGIRDYNFAQLIAWVPANAGGVPLGYITRYATVHVLGYSTFSGRLPSPMFSLVACAGVFVLARGLKLRFPLLAVVIFCLTPLQLRYALESRPYSLALALSVWSTVVFVDLLERVTFVRAFRYGVMALLGLYTQPYTVFVPVAHIAWLCCVREYADRWRLLLVSGVSVALAAAGFVPWYLWTAHAWGESVATAHLRYKIEPRAALLILRELVGAGYLGTALILGAAWMGVKYGLPNNQVRLFWAFYAILPVLLALLADAVFGYFLAVRQMIFVLVPLSLLTALGIEAVAEQRRRVAGALGCLVITVFLIADVRFFLRPREDWRAASSILQGLAQRGGCILFAPASSEGFYEFFVPELGRAKCREEGLSAAPGVAMAVSPYGPREEPQLIRRLSESGFRKTQEFNRQGPRVELYKR